MVEEGIEEVDVMVLFSPAEGPEKVLKVDPVTVDEETVEVTVPLPVTEFDPVKDTVPVVEEEDPLGVLVLDDVCEKLSVPV